MKRLWSTWKDLELLKHGLNTGKCQLRDYDDIEPFRWYQWLSVNDLWEIATLFDHDAVIDFGSPYNSYLILRCKQTSTLKN